MKYDIIQSSFGAGEIAPAIFGRVDIAQYANACEIVENFLIKTSGSAISTPGTTYIQTVSNSTLQTRLIKFVFNRTDAYVIEMGHKYFRFYTNQGIVITTGTTPYVLTHIYSNTEIWDVQYTQLNDVIYFAHPDYPPQQLTRLAAASWTIGGLVFIGGPFLEDYAPPQASPAGSVTAATVLLTASNETAGAVGNVTVSPTNASTFTVSGSTLGHKFSYWKIWGMTVETNASTGLKEVGYVQLTDIINSYTATSTTIKALRKSAVATKIWAEGAWSAVRGYPASVVFNEKRLFFARTDKEPTKIWGSRVFKFEDFALDTEADDDGLNLGLASNESNEILWLAQAKSVIAGTFGGTFVINSGSSDPITPTNAQAIEQVGFGVSPIRPVKIGSFLYYVQRFGRRLREMFFSFDLDAYKSVDRTVLAPHILGDGVTDMDVAENPEPIIYCVLTSGTLATMTREVDQEMTAWARQTTNGTYTSVAVIPSQSGLYDEVWAIVRRWVNGVEKQYVELFDPIDVPAQQYDCLYLHSALTYSAYASTNTSAVSISLSASSGSVTLTSSGAYFNGAMIGKRIRAINAAGDTVGQGQITATASTTSITLSITTNFNSLTYAKALWGVSVSSVSGMDHLEAKTIGILADGLTESLTRTVASGVVTLGSDYWVISLGLSYNQDLLTLPKELVTDKGTTQGKWQRYSEIVFRVNKSTQNFKYGTDVSNLDDINLAVTPTVTTLYSGIIPPQAGGIAMRGGYKRGAQVYVRNSQPLPLEILEIMGDLQTYER